MPALVSQAIPISWMAAIALDNMRRIAVITTSRADYSHLYWVLKGLQTHPEVDLRLLVSGSHLAPSFGQSVDQIVDDGFSIEARIEALIDSDTDIGMAKTIGMASLGLADVLGDLRPDVLLIIADRYEMLAPAAVATALRIPIAHIEGGEISEGAIDDAIRNALTKLAHLHFVSTQLAKRRVVAMGEESWRVVRAGAPSLDHLIQSELLNQKELEKALDLDLSVAPKIVAFHPVTLSDDSDQEVAALFQALETVEGPIIFSFPNADAGHQIIIDKAKQFCANRSNATVFTNLGPIHYWSLLQHAELMIGNSSSGIMETPSLALPCINVGLRQKGRERAKNIIDVPAQASEIVAGIETAQSKAFKERLVGMENPYGDGQAARRIIETLTTCPLGSALLVKKARPPAEVSP
mgnify:CR=1 FL=1